MHHRETGMPVVVRKRQHPQPVQQFGAVVCRQDFIQGIARVHILGLAVTDRQQVQFVVAQHGDGGISQVFRETQTGQ